MGSTYSGAAEDSISSSATGGPSSGSPSRRAITWARSRAFGARRSLKNGGTPRAGVLRVFSLGATTRRSSVDYQLMWPLEGHDIYVGPRGLPTLRGGSVLDLRLERMFRYRDLQLAGSLDSFNFFSSEAITELNSSGATARAPRPARRRYRTSLSTPARWERSGAGCSPRSMLADPRVCVYLALTLPFPSGGGLQTGVRDSCGSGSARLSRVVHRPLRGFGRPAQSAGSPPAPGGPASAERDQICSRGAAVTSSTRRLR
jgi:hypothetical protein